MNHLGADAKATIQGLIEKMPKDVKAEVVIAPFSRIFRRLLK